MFKCWVTVLIFALSSSSIHSMNLRPTQKIKKDRVISACKNCQKAKKKCDTSLECERCVTKKMLCIRSSRESRQKIVTTDSLCRLNTAPSIVDFASYQPSSSSFETNSLASQSTDIETSVLDLEQFIRQRGHYLNLEDLAFLRSHHFWYNFHRKTAEEELLRMRALIQTTFDMEQIANEAFWLTNSND